MPLIRRYSNGERPSASAFAFWAETRTIAAGADYTSPELTVMGLPSLSFWFFQSTLAAPGTTAVVQFSYLEDVITIWRDLDVSYNILPNIVRAPIIPLTYKFAPRLIRMVLKAPADAAVTVDYVMSASL